MTDSSTIIRVTDVSKRFVIRKEKSLKERIVNFGRSRQYREDFWALRNVTFDIAEGTTVGLLGANGSGKSTLLKAVGGILQPTSGIVQHRGRLAALLELGAGFHPDLTGRENVYLNAAILGLTRKETDKHFAEIVDFSGIEPFIDTQVKFYSSGMYVRLAFAVAVHVNPDVLLVDEVLAVGDEPFQRKCLDKIRSFQAEGRTIVLVSHSLETVGDMCDRGIVLRRGSVVYDGETAGALRELRAGFAAAAVLQNTDDEEIDDSDPASFAGVVSSRLLDPATGEPIQHIRSGSAAQLEVTVRSRRELTEWIVGMGIESTLGQVIFGTNTARLGMDATPFTGDKTFVFDLPRLDLGAGQYIIHASLGTQQRGTFVRVPEAARLDVEDGLQNVGLLSVRATVTS